MGPGSAPGRVVVGGGVRGSGVNRKKKGGMRSSEKGEEIFVKKIKFPQNNEEKKNISYTLSPTYHLCPTIFFFLCTATAKHLDRSERTGR